MAKDLFATANLRPCPQAAFRHAHGEHLNDENRLLHLHPRQCISPSYIGSTANLASRLHQHRNKLIPGFTRDHNMTMLVYFEEFATPHEMVARERQLKGWVREKKVALIERTNPAWLDLSAEWEH